MKKFTLICATLLLATLALSHPFRLPVGWVNTPAVVRAEISGKDGALTVSAPNTIVNKYGVLAVDAPAGASFIAVTNPGGPNGLDLTTLTPGDLILIIQMAGASIDASNTFSYGSVTNLNSAGRHEFVTVSAVETNMIRISPPCGGLRFSYSAAGKTQVIRVPQYTTLTVNSGASLTAPAWNGQIGGIVAAHVQSNAIINGVVDVTGLGYRGGALSSAGGGGLRTDYVTNQQDFGAEKGEGLAGYQVDYDMKGGRYGRGAPGNGGGGATSHNAGGGGGANGNNGKTWTGQGVMDGSVVGAAAWTLDPGYIANGNQLTDSSGGGRGGYSYAVNEANALTQGPGNSAWGGDNRRDVGGLGGRPAPQDTAGRLFFGGGGGAGAQNNDSGGAGGNGGGLIYIIADQVSGTGTLRSNGLNGGGTRNDHRDGAGGGGAGGTIVVSAKTLSGVSAQANGGNGGNQSPPVPPFTPESEGPGGGGGGGFIAYTGGSISTQVQGGLHGSTQAPSLAEFPANGTTRGATGTTSTVITSIPFCSTTSDIAVTKTNNSNTIVPGAPTTYTIVVRNNGPNDVFGIPVTDNLPAVFTNATWTCAATAGSSCQSASGAGAINTTVNLLNGGTATFQLTATPNPAATGQVTNTVTIAPPDGAIDTNPSNNTASDTDTFTPQADLSITKTDGVTSVTAGTALTYTIVVRNNGPSTAGGATVTDVIPPQLTSATWTCTASTGGSCPQAMGSGNINGAVNLAPGATATFTVTATVLSTATGSVTNTATVASPPTVPDTAPSNNSASDTDAINVSGDLSITKTNNATSLVPGAQTTYTIIVSNSGPGQITGATVTDNLPANLANASWTCAATPGSSCAAASGSGAINTTVTLLNGGTATFTLTATVVSTATGAVSNTASVAAPPSATDPNSNNNSATDTDPLQPTADLSITKSNNGNSVTAGASVTYNVVVTNNGPSAVTGATVTDNIPAQLTGATWTCTASPPASGNSCGSNAGVGNINATVTLNPGAMATFVITATVRSDATGQVTNTATVTAPNGVTDPTPTNNTATDSDSIGRSANLAIIKTANPTIVPPGSTVTYTIEVTNSGPSDVTGASVNDILPAPLNNASWTCVATPGSSCGAASGPGSIVTTVNLLVGGKATFTLTATVASDYSGTTLANTAMVTPPAGTTDPNNSNNSSTSTINTTPAADLRITKTASPNPVRATEEVTFTITVTNGGPSTANNVTVTDPLPSGLTLISATATGGSCAGTDTVVCTIASIGANNSATVTIRARVGAQVPAGPLSNTATVSSATTDPNNGNNSATATTTVTQPPGARFRSSDIAIRTTNTDACIDGGDVLTVEVKLTNSGDGKQNDNPGSEFTALLPTQLAGVIGSCSASNGTCAVGAAQVDWNGSVNVGETVTITYRARVREGIQVGTRFCTDFRVNFDTNNDGQNDSTTTATQCQEANCQPAPCSGPDCPEIGPGISLADNLSLVGSDQRPGSILIFPLYISDPASPNRENTRINITNIDPVRPAYLHLFFIDGSQCSVADNFLCLTPNQTASFLISDVDPGVAGYLIAVAVDSEGCPTQFNNLIGDEYVKLSSGHSANLGAEAAVAYYSPKCSTDMSSATIQFDGKEYSLLGRVVAADNIPSLIDGDSTLLILNRIGGDLTTEADAIGPLFGLLYDDQENAFSFTVNVNSCQLRTLLNQNFPRTAPRFPTIVPAGHTGWMKLWVNTPGDEGALVGATISVNPNPGGFRGGHNLHKLTLGQASLTIPLLSPSCQ